MEVEAIIAVISYTRAKIDLPPMFFCVLLQDNNEVEREDLHSHLTRGSNF